jgi:branched-chain amino acid transport system ATP-binding protein
MILELKNITLSFTGGRDTFKILNDLNMSVERGKITALIGGNGVGKTTLFNIISGFQRNFQGRVVFSDKAISKWPPHRVSRRGIGRLFQGKPLLRDLTLLENMKLAAADATGEFPFSHLFRKKTLEAKEKEKETQAVEILNRLFGENNKYVSMLNDRGSAFSYGEQRLLSLAGLFMGDYSLLLLDEPTAGVNPKYMETLKGIIRQMVVDGSKTVFLIEHNMQFVNGIADTCVFLEGGRIAVQGKTESVLSNQAVRNSYLGIR